MRKLVLSLVSLGFLFALPQGVAYAAALETSSRVSEATIFADRALVTRTAKIHLPAGSHAVTISNLPASMNEATLRVQGKAAAAVKIGTVDVKKIFMAEQGNAAQREKTAQIDAKTNEKAILSAEIKALHAKMSFINKLIEAGVEKQDPNTGKAKSDFAPEKWQQAWNFIQTGMAEAGKELANKNVAMAKIDADLSKLQQELAQIRSQQAKERRDAQVTVEAAAETDLELSLTYQTTGAKWRPFYDARLDTNNGQLTMEQYGLVSQVTGEDWDDVAVTLSTAQPAQGTEMPKPVNWIVRLLMPVQEQTVFEDLASFGDGMRAQKMMSKAAGRANEAMPAGGIAPAPAPMEMVEAEIETAAVAATEYSAEFKVPGRVALKSSRDKTKLLVGATKMKAELSAQTTPRLNPSAYLFAKATNGESYPLVPGEVAKYRDGAFIGNAALPLVRPNEMADFAFGVDDRIKVDYRLVKEKQDNPSLVMMGDMSIERLYETKIQNLHKAPISVTVFEQSPVSGDADVKVSIMDSSTTQDYAEAKNMPQGVISWSGTYAPKEEKTINFGFRVKYPKGRVIEGL